MYKLTGVIEGVVPILFNRMPDGQLTGPGGKPTAEKEQQNVRERCHRNAAGDIVLPSWSLKRCIIGGASLSGVKEGRYGIGKLLEATMFVDGELNFGVGGEPDFIHSVPGRIPPGPKGSMVILNRPALDAGWRLPFALIITDDRRNGDAIRRSIEEAGLLGGLGAWRPEYGRFILREFERSSLEA